MPPPVSITDAIFGAALLAGAFLSWSVIVKRIRDRRPLLSYEPRAHVPWSIVDVLAIFSIFIYAQYSGVALAKEWLGIPGDLASIAQQPRGHLASLIGNIIGSVATFALALVIAAGRSGATLADLGFDMNKARADAVRGLTAFFAVAPFIFLIQFLLIYLGNIKYEHPLVEVLQKQSDRAALALALIAGVVVAPLVEEFLIRVILQGWLEKLELQVRGNQGQVWEPPLPADRIESNVETVAGVRPTVEPITPVPVSGAGGLPLGVAPIFVSSMIFALLHLGQGAAPIPIFIFALVLGFLYQRTHRIMPSLVAHFALNSLSMLMLLFAESPAGK